MFNRNLLRKERLVAYVQYFVEDELKHGKISSRCGESASRKMD
jgi:hypothetical protein